MDTSMITFSEESLESVTPPRPFSSLSTAVPATTATATTSTAQNVISIGTSTEHDELIYGNLGKWDLLGDDIGQLDLSPLLEAEQYVSQIVSLLSDPTSNVQGFRRSSRPFRRLSVVKPSKPSALRSSRTRKLIESEENAKESKILPYKQLLQNAVEYVALFRVNRPAQSDITAVNDVRGTEEAYTDLLEVSERMIVLTKHKPGELTSTLPGHNYYRR
jgi:hypothetical protein